MDARKPIVTIIAGPNGSGKSTLTAMLRRQGIEFGIYINADEIEKRLDGPPGEERSRAAQAEAERQRQECLTRRVDFAFETVMSHASKIALMAQAQLAGYSVVLYFVALENATLNVERVRQRVALGGHPVPEDRIVTRYRRCLELLPAALPHCDRAVLFDNSYRATEGGRVMMRPFCEVLIERDETGAPSVAFHSVRGGPVTAADQVPGWAHDILPPAVYEERKRPVRDGRRTRIRRR